MQIGAVGQLSPGNQSTSLSGSERAALWLCYDVDDVIGHMCVCVCECVLGVHRGACACGGTRQAIKPENAN